MTSAKQTVQLPHRPVFGVFGGSFNPVHRGHLDVVRGVLEAGGVEQLLVVPAARSPFKEEPGLLPGAVRLDMVRRALRGTARVSVVDLEIRRPPPSYTLDTLVALGALFPAAQFKLVMGLDTFHGFAEWHCAAAILRRAGLLLFQRNGAAQGGDPAGWIAHLPEAWRQAGLTVAERSLVDGSGQPVAEMITLSTTDISSTRIRQSRSLQDVPPEARTVLLHHAAEEMRAGNPVPDWLAAAAQEAEGR